MDAGGMRAFEHGFGDSRGVGSVAVSFALAGAVACGVMAASPAQAAPAHDISASTQTAVRDTPVERGDSPANDAVRGIVGVASVVSKPVINGRVRVFSITARGLRAVSTPRADIRTNRRGGFHAAVPDLPGRFVVKVTGGTAGGRRVQGSLFAVGRATEQAVVATEASTVTAMYALKHPRLGWKKWVRHIARLLELPVASTTSSVHFGVMTKVESLAFSPGAYQRGQRRSGLGRLAFAKRLAMLAQDRTARRPFVDKAYRPPLRPGYRSVETRAVSVQDGAAGDATDVLIDVLQTVIYPESCPLTTPSLVDAMACGGQPAATDAINALLADANNVAATLDQLAQQTASVDNQAVIATFNNAYGIAGIDEIYTSTNEAAMDLVSLSAGPPPGAATINPAGSTAQQQCEAAGYSSVYANGMDPLSVCEDFLNQAGTFSAGGSYASLYSSLTGANALPPANLLTPAYQQVLNDGGQTLLTESMLAEVQDNMGQLMVLQDDAFALLINAQTFAQMVQIGQQPNCPDLTTSGAFPASTPLTTSDACSTSQTALFEAAVENDLYQQVAVPPDGWTPAMLTGAPPGGVPAVPVPAPS